MGFNAGFKGLILYVVENYIYSYDINLEANTKEIQMKTLNICLSHYLLNTKGTQ